jgi:hypothetical protein
VAVVGNLQIAAVGQGDDDFASQSGWGEITSSTKPITNSGVAMLREAGKRLLRGER